MNVWPLGPSRASGPPPGPLGPLPGPLPGLWAPSRASGPPPGPLGPLPGLWGPPGPLGPPKNTNEINELDY